MTDNRELEVALRERIARRAARNWQLIVASLALVAAVAFVQYRGTSERTAVVELAEQTAATFCDFKRNLIVTQRGADEYIAAVEAGERVLPPGITLGDLRTQRLNRQRTIDSLDELECNPPPAPAGR